jgi:hypothetical protein
MLHYIRDTKTQMGLTVQAHLVTEKYETGVKHTIEKKSRLDLHVNRVLRTELGPKRVLNRAEPRTYAVSDVRQGSV